MLASQLCRVQTWSAPSCKTFAAEMNHSARSIAVTRAGHAKQPAGRGCLLQQCNCTVLQHSALLLLIATSHQTCSRPLMMHRSAPQLCRHAGQPLSASTTSLSAAARPRRVARLLLQSACGKPLTAQPVTDTPLTRARCRAQRVWCTPSLHRCCSLLQATHTQASYTREMSRPKSLVRTQSLMTSSWLRRLICAKVS